MISETLDIKYCPSCGKDQFKRTAEKLFVCNNCDFHYYHNPAAAAAVILEWDDKILLTVRKFDPGKGSLDLPGGFIDYHESGEEGLARELKEELNLDIEKFTYMQSFPNEYKYKEVQYYTLDQIYIARIEQVPHLQAADDISDFIWVKPKDIEMDKIALKSIKKAVSYYISNHAS